MSRCGPSSSMHSLVLWRLIHSHPNNSMHPFFQPNYKSIVVMPMNVKDFDNFFGDQFLCPDFIQNCEFRCFVQNAKFAISFVFRPKWISCVPYNVPVITIVAQYSLIIDNFQYNHLNRSKNTSDLSWNHLIQFAWWHHYWGTSDNEVNIT